jgi:6-phosphogluconolactonase
MRTKLSLIGAVAIAACTDATAPSFPERDASLSASASTRRAEIVGGVFTQTNAAAGNAVIAYARRADGSLSYLGSYSTGGNGTVQPDGTGGGLGSQGAVLLTPNERVLLAVNAGSNQISSFAVGKDGLKLVSTVPSGGERPVSVAATDRIAYVINNASNSVTGFRIRRDGRLTPVGRWTRSLSPGAGNGAQVQFTKDGRFLVVVERTSATFDVFPVREDGSLGAPVSSPAVGRAPFGFDITAKGQVIVSEPGPNTGGTPQSMTSYDLRRDGRLTAVHAGVPTFQTAPCWVVITENGRFAYSANAGSGSISGFAVAPNGALRLLTVGGATGITGAGSTPLDLDVTRNSRFLYVIEGGTGNVMGFAIGNDGSLSSLGEASRPEAARGRGGLAAY